jgi:EmrB/QacA subfamily drug resistance transporter
MQYRWVALSVTTVGTLMASLDTNIVVIALPTIARQLAGVSVLILLWILIGYSLVTAVLILNLGRVADLYGRVRLYTLGFLVFTVGSALCGLSQLGIELVGFRIVQAIGAAFLFANSTAIVTDAFPPHERGMALGINQISIVVGSVSGLVLGGLLTAVAGWRAIFFVNVPIGIFGVLWAHLRLRELAVTERVPRTDWWGNTSFAAGIALVLVGATFGSLKVLSLVFTAVVIALGFVILALFVAVERRVPFPMLDVSLFRNRLFAAGNVSIFLNSLARGTFSFVIVFFLQGPPHLLDPLRAGLYLVPVSAALAASAPFSGSLSDRFGARPFATAGLGLSAAGFLLLTQIGPTTTFLQLLPAFLLVGAGMGIFASPNRASIMNSVPAHRRGVAAGMSTTLVTTGNTFSLAFSIATLSTVMSLGNIVSVFLGGAAGGSNPVSAVGPFVSAVRLVFGISAGLTLAAIIPSALRGHEQGPRLRGPLRTQSPHPHRTSRWGYAPKSGGLDSSGS